MTESSFPRSARPSGIRLGYFIAVALVCGGAVAAFGTIPSSLGGVVALVTVAMMTVIDRLARRSFDPRPRGGAAVAHLVVSALTFVGSLGWVIFAKRPDVLWPAWALAALVLVVVALGAWVPARSVAAEVAAKSADGGGR